ncbi:MAG: protein kinase [Deltaproteobacteria bacterium]|nr:protein kinase [Deltaproteobacteria bacterium]
MKNDPYIGRKIADKFRIIDFIGQGGMGSVYLAEHETLPRRFAIKILKSEYMENEQFVERFRREAIAASRVVHPNIVYITDFGRLNEGNYYIVMEYLEGEGLDTLLDSQGKLPLSRAVPIIMQVADGLNHAHRMGVVHRDIKAENVLLTTERGKRDVVKLLDFGIASLLLPNFSSTRITAHGQVFGTPEYMSPEQASAKPLDGRSDIYSLGVLAFELVTGMPPFWDEDPTEILQSHLNDEPPAPSEKMPDQKIPKLFDAIVLKCLAKDPSQRYANASDVRNELLRVRSMLTPLASKKASDSKPIPIISDTQAYESDFEAAEVKVILASGKSVVALRNELHEVLKELSFRLLQEEILDRSFSHVLDTIIENQSEITSLGNAITLREQDFERIRFEMGQREKNLRYAILDLDQEYKNVESKEQKTPVDEKYLRDLAYQVESLSAALKKIIDDRRSAFADLNKEIDSYKKSVEERELEISANYVQLSSSIEKARVEDPRASSIKFGALFEKLGHLRVAVEKLRFQASSMK